MYHYRKHGVFRVLEPLPCASFRAHDKGCIRRVPRHEAYGESSAHGKKALFAVCLEIKHTAKSWHTAKCTVCRVPRNKTHGET